MTNETIDSREDALRPTHRRGSGQRLLIQTVQGKKWPLFGKDSDMEEKFLKAEDENRTFRIDPQGQGR